MPGPTKNTSIPDIEALLEQGWNILLNTPEQLKDIAATVQVFTDRMKKGKRVIVHGDGTSIWTVTHSDDFANKLSK